MLLGGTLTLEPRGVSRSYFVRYDPQGTLTWLAAATGKIGDNNCGELILIGSQLHVDATLRGNGNEFGGVHSDAVAERDFMDLEVVVP